MTSQNDTEKKACKIFNLKIISAQNLPPPTSHSGMKTYVKINVYGIPSDYAEFKTTTKTRQSQVAALTYHISILFLKKN